MTHTYNQPELIHWQNAAFKKFLKDDYRFVVFNDAPNAQTSQETRTLCEALGISCIDVPQSIHHYTAPYLPGSRNPFGDPSAECADTIQYMLDTLGFDHPGLVAIFDSDMFLIREFSLEKEMQGYAIGGHPQYRQSSQERITYLLPNLVFLDMSQLPDKRSLNFNVGSIYGVNVDTGGYTYYYLQQHPEVPWLQTDCVTAPYLATRTPLEPEVLEYFNAHPKMFQLMTEMRYDYEFYDRYTFMHFRAGSNWYKMAAEKRLEKTRLFYEALEEVLGEF
jgi:hypothetical protein